MRPFLSIMFTVLCFPVIAQEKINSAFAFLENKGQLTDQYQHQRNDIFYYGQSKGMAYFLKEQGISYQLYQPLNKDYITIQRLDIDFVGINKKAVLSSDEAVNGNTHFYLANNPNGILNVKSFATVSYKEIYKGIDLKYYFKEGNLEYDYVIQPFADASVISFKVNGVLGIIQNKDGSITLKTPLGDIQEEKPIAYQGNIQVAAKWLVKDNILSYELGNYDPSKPLIIDPLVRIWGSYFGGNGSDLIRGNCVDNNGYVFISGVTESTNNIATIGAFQTSLLGTRDCFVSKFDSGGNRLWATYYGGSNVEDYGKCSLDNNNHVFLFGTTASLDLPVTSSCYQSFLGGGVMDAFWIKFTTNGIRQYATYYGGNGGDVIHDIVFDSLNNCYISGTSTSTNAIATAGAYQTVLGGSGDVFLSKFDSSFNRIWSTYYGGNDVEGYGNMIWGIDKKLYLFGGTRSSNGIATSNAFQSTFSGLGSNYAMDAYFVKFDTSGNRIWGTYYGWSGVDETAQTCLSNDSGLFYIMGRQGQLGFIAKFDTIGNNHWVNSYPGGIYGSRFSSSGNLLICGETTSTTGIGYVGSYQQFYSGNLDAFIAEITPFGVKKWGTYYGSNGNSEGLLSISKNSNNDVYIGGFSNSVNNISTIGSFQPSNGGDNDGVLIKFSECSVPTPTIEGNDTTVCLGSSIILSTSPTTNTNYYWVKDTTVLSNNQNTLNVSQAGNYSLVIVANGCPSFTSDTINVTVLPVIQPTIFITSSPSNVPAGQQVTVNANIGAIGGYPYTIDWYNHGSLFASTTTNTTTYTKQVGKDSIKALITVNSPCNIPDTSNLAVVDGITDISTQNQFLVYPNPATNTLYLQSQQTGSLVLTDITGRVILQSSVINHTSQIDLSTLAKGVYLLKYCSDDGAVEIVNVVKE